MVQVSTDSLENAVMLTQFETLDQELTINNLDKDLHLDHKSTGAIILGH